MMGPSNRKGAHRMKSTIAAPIGIAVAASLLLAGCGAQETPAEPEGPVTITVSGWSFETTPEFKLLADGFHAENPNVTVELVEYDPAEYSTLVTADLGAGTAPDIITQKEVKYVPVFVDGEQLLDVSDVELPDGLGGVSSYEVDGAQYAVPYRQDSWVLYYNKDIFDAAGVDYPDGSWTWDDYADAAKDIKAATGKNGAYEHRWQSTTQGFANAQSKGADIFSGDYEYFKSYYETRLDLQASGAEVDYNTSKANSLTYQAEFGKQNAAMLTMGTWYVATLISQQASGDADTFNWGFAPAPQLTSSTAGLDKTPVTFGDPTAFGINAAISEDKIAAAKSFLAYAAGEGAASALAGIGITPALTNDVVAEAYFAVAGAPSDDLSKFAWSTHETKPENPTSADTAAVQNILNTVIHDPVLAGATSIDDAIKAAKTQFEAEVG